MRTQPRALGEERHFALVDGLRFPTWARANRSGQELSPTQPSLRSPTAIMITCSNSPKGSGMPNHYVVPGLQDGHLEAKPYSAMSVVGDPKATDYR